MESVNGLTICKTLHFFHIQFPVNKSISHRVVLPSLRMRMVSRGVIEYHVEVNDVGVFVFVVVEFQPSGGAIVL